MRDGAPDASALVQVRDLRVVARKDSGAEFEIVKGVDFSLHRGEVLALIGESGSGKTTIALSMLGYARRGCRISGGSVRIGDTEVLGLDEEGLRKLRGRTVSYIAQSAAASFNPSRRIMDQVVECALIHQVMSREAAEAKAVGLFEALALPDPKNIGSRYPHQVSGGQLQRLMAAMALITDPVLVVLDEPTTALDVTTQIEVLRAFKRVVRELNTTAVYVSHDLAVVAQMADRIVVLNGGEIKESGETAQVLHSPRDEYTRSLLAAVKPEVRVVQEENAAELPAPLLEIRGLMAGYGMRDARGRPKVTVLENIDLVIRRGMTVGVIGESGSGKTTLARVVAGMVAPTPGSLVRFDGADLPPSIETRNRDHFRRIQIVFQNADTALNPSHRIEDIIGRPLTFYHGLTGDARRKRVLQLLDLVRLPATMIDRRSSELSGGQKQRINLARALGAEPDLILCDEVTSALDTVVGAAILELLADLRRDLGVSYLFISHDISTVRAICDEIVVLYAGRTVEVGAREAMLQAPFHPYSHMLISSVPELRQGWLDSLPKPEGLPTIGNPTGADLLCPFIRRCPVRVDGRCNTVAPPRRRLADKDIFCHREPAELHAWQTGNGVIPIVQQAAVQYSA
ncbi:dipeptide ABC transporter ATP-binding protein [Pigmentiphaga aceris]|uniref:Dipeptide ABC transporter ATP-binding protein n=1 Tax=Pigmentiphaga aceris TaxID=1940612 RepID=A0A5C0B350_9BURK|nr:ABC transporter ATP-binding protein [Pigmentiphaga aceris]QEI09299.1 dipeptide ABC transporter ATP-binding protein [Pigmentiphaga aceris]